MRRITALLFNSALIFLLVCPVYAAPPIPLFHHPSLWIIIILAIVILCGLASILYILFAAGYNNKPVLHNTISYINNLWNAPSMVDHRNHAAEKITDELLNDIDTSRRHHAEALCEFFNHLGYQVHTGILPLAAVHQILGSELLRYWHEKNYQHLVRINEEEYKRKSPYSFSGFEYLVEQIKSIPIQPYSYQPSSAMTPHTPPMSPINIMLYIFGIIAVISIIALLLVYFIAPITM